VAVSLLNLVATRSRNGVGEVRCDQRFSPWEEDVMKALFNRFVREEAGQDLIEYALLAGFISLATVAVVDAIGGSLNTLYGKVNSQISSAGQ
jgi:pilus assembly protein Flp/PilA